VDNSDLVIDFNKDDKCRLAMKVVNDKLSDFSKLNDIIIEGLKDAVAVDKIIKPIYNFKAK